jgi:hypothetical protein
MAWFAMFMTLRWIQRNQPESRFQLWDGHQFTDFSVISISTSSISRRFGV